MDPTGYYELARIRGANNRPSDPEERALKLFKQWLTPAQLEQYKNNWYIDVIGCHTKRRYRIDCGYQSFNITEIDKNERPIAKFCLTPKEKGLPTRDRLLAQKIALEINEYDALKIANRGICVNPFTKWFRRRFRS